MGILQKEVKKGRKPVEESAIKEKVEQPYVSNYSIKWGDYNTLIIDFTDNMSDDSGSYTYRVEYVLNKKDHYKFMKIYEDHVEDVEFPINVVNQIKSIVTNELRKSNRLKDVEESLVKESKYTYTASVKDKSGKGVASVKGTITATDEKDAKGKVGEILTIDKGYNQNDIKDVSVKLKESLNEEDVSFEEISFMMESAEDYDDMYEAANLIADPSLREEVIALIDDCEQDDDDIDVCYSIVTSDLIDDKINEPNVLFNESNTVLKEETKLKRIGRYSEFDNGRVLYNWKEMSSEEAENLARDLSIKNPNEIYYVLYDDIMDPGSNLYWINGESYNIDEYDITRPNGMPKIVKRDDLNMIKNNSKLGESIKLNEGAGAGYTIECSVNFQEVNDIKITSIDETQNGDGRDVHFICNAKGVVYDLVAESYMYSANINNIPCKLVEGIIEVWNSDFEGMSGSLLSKYLIESDYIKHELLHNTYNISIIYGGGYVHSQYDGSICTISDSNAIDTTGELIAADIKLINTDAIKYIDDGVRGENIYSEFEVYDSETYEEIETYDNEDDAINFAKSRGYNVQEQVFEETFDGDTIFIDQETIYYSNDLDESYGGAFDIDENQYFTKEEIEEFAESVKDEVEKTANNAPLKVTDVYTTNNGFGGDFLTIFIEDFEGNEYDYDVRIDMRKIRKPSDLYKYKDEFVDHFENQFCVYDCLEESFNEVDDFGPYYVKIFVDGDDMDTVGFDNEADACYWAKDQVKSNHCDQACVYDTETEECLYIYDSENVNESVGLNEDSKKPWGEKAYNLNEIISSMNDEEAYFGGWLYIWPDGEDLDQACYDFGTKEEYEELETSFKKYYRAYHKYGLYTPSKRIEDMAHAWDEKLGLPPIENFYKERD